MEAPGGFPILLLHNATVVTMDSKSPVYGDCAVIIERDRTKAVGHLPDLLRRFRSVAGEVVDLRGQILLPSFVNTHVHTSQQLARGIADDVDLVTWLHDRIWPYEASMTEEDSYVSTLLCRIELIHSGHVPGMARVVQSMGLRACLAQSVMDSGEGLPASWAVRTAEDYVQSHKELYEKHHDTADGWIEIWLGIRQIMNCTNELLIATRDTTRELKTDESGKFFCVTVNRLCPHTHVLEHALVRAPAVGLFHEEARALGKYLCTCLSHMNFSSLFRSFVRGDANNENPSTNRLSQLSSLWHVLRGIPSCLFYRTCMIPSNLGSLGATTLAPTGGTDPGWRSAPIHDPIGPFNMSSRLLIAHGVALIN
ncbi:hypothetical protein ACJRO7_033159 [Eucalyptus globulus]|uniref:Amidohydrolase-related domain-containing protein n=1 Tax=Eucalyptus globulus TaxID=34317 RepID=A0ABD3JL98_EUCGL